MRFRLAPVLLAASMLLAVPPSQGAALSAAANLQYSPLDQIAPDTLARLRPAWQFRTGELGQGLARADKLTFETVPLVVGRRLYVTTATGTLFALDGATGKQLWRFDAGIDRSQRYAEMANRGVAHWHAEGTTGPCSDRLFLATLDARLIALDAESGVRCPGFGNQGEIALWHGVRLQARPEYAVTSRPTIVGNVVITGSSVGDNRATSVELGVVRGYDVLTGRLLWHWDPIPRAAKVPARASDPDFDEVGEQAASWTGAANAWITLAGDAARDLVFIPTGSAAPDFFGGERPGDNRWANSLVALRASTGEIVWAQQLVHHDLWDYDLASPPILSTVARDGRAIDVVIQLTKTGQAFVFERDSGTPVFPIEERPVPQSDVAGEIASPTQPVSSLPPLVRWARIEAKDAWGLTFWDRGKCAEAIGGLRSEGMFTPPSLGGSVMLPSYVGGANWGGGAFDPQRQILVVPVNSVPATVTLYQRDGFNATAEQARFSKSEFAAQRGTPYIMRREILLSPLGIPCTPPPWGELVALDLARGEIRWRRPLGTSRRMAPWPFWWIDGMPALGGALVTASGLAFAGAADDRLRAFAIEDGRELWSADLPAGPQATPVSYEIDGRQFVVIAVGGHAGLGTTRGDFVVAFTLAPTQRP